MFVTITVHVRTEIAANYHVFNSLNAIIEKSFTPVRALIEDCRRHG